MKRLSLLLTLPLLALLISALPGYAQAPPNVVWNRGFGTLLGVQYSADGTLQAVHSTAAGSGGGTIRIMRSSDNMVLRTLNVPFVSADFYAFSPDGTMVAYEDASTTVTCVSSVDGHVLWSVQQPMVGNDPGTKQVAFTSDSKSVIHTASVDGHNYNYYVVERDAKTGALKYEWQGEGFVVNPAAPEVAVNYPPNNQTVNSEIDFWDTNTGGLNGTWHFTSGNAVESPQLPAPLSGECAGYSGDGSLIYIPGEGGLIGGFVAVRRADEKLVAGIGGFFPNLALATAGHSLYLAPYTPWDTTTAVVYRWNVDTGALTKVANPPAQGQAFGYMAPTPDDTQLALICSDPVASTRLDYYSTADGTHLGRAIGTGTSTVTMAMAPDGAHFATAGATSPEVTIWETATGAIAARYVMATNGTRSGVIFSMAWSQDGNTIAVSSQYWDAVSQVNVPTTQLIRASDGHLLATVPAGIRVNALAFVGDGTRLVTGGDDGSIDLWDLTVNPPATIVGKGFNFTGSITSLAYTSAAGLLAVGSGSGYIVVLNANDLTYVSNYRQSFYGINSVAFSADGNSVAASVANSGVAVYRIGQSGLTQTHFYDLLSPDQFYQPMAFDPAAAKYMARAYRDPITGMATLGVFDTSNPNYSDDTPTESYTAEVGYSLFHASQIAYTPDGKYIAYTVPTGGVTVIKNPNYTPPPTLNTLAPNTVIAGGGAATITLTGSGFLNSSQVMINGSGVATTYVSATTLSAVVPAGMVTAPGTVSVTVVNHAPGSGTSQTQTLTVIQGSPKLVFGTVSVTRNGNGSVTVNFAISNVGTSSAANVKTTTCKLLGTGGSSASCVTGPVTLSAAGVENLSVTFAAGLSSGSHVLQVSGSSGAVSSAFTLSTLVNVP